VTQEQNFTQSELTLAVLQIELMITRSLKHNAEMPFMLFLVLRKDQDVINEDHNKLVQLCHEYRVHQVHEVSGGV
jgi:ABC-type lipoprotein export system ATPase subunit